ncbi:hypothetical protein [Aurantiacibacter gangjinensis]|uniref:Uncharacterized protein n=1 Tax=Aurantiacibacter gangjinensis TaxID=502682 RepID=A0A0G9ML85_9SPHN|nr:hypothetical protein [Aurantiacibacter gangjinensis]APE27256.1 hypothetical protein BMF35_a0427 [Aurantiacibacter gangjinensis]KLE31374.1 hypothetical protein AAW01_07150 [Aurantiacibacter gangjinensis]
MTERPDGSTPTTIGWMLIIIGVMSALMANSADSNEGFYLALFFANLGIGLGVLLCSLGYLARAIWFLPGRTLEAEQAYAEPQKEEATCAYCKKVIAGPAQPCSAVDPQALQATVERIDDDECLRALHAEGLLLSDDRQD